MWCQAFEEVAGLKIGDKIRILKPMSFKVATSDVETGMMTINPGEIYEISSLENPYGRDPLILDIQDDPAVITLDMLDAEGSLGEGFEIVNEETKEASVKVKADGASCEAEVEQYMKDHPEASREDAEKAARDAKGSQVESQASAGWLAREASTPEDITPEQAQKMVVQAFGYTDLQGQLQAAFIMGTAQKTVFNAAVRDIKKKHGPEIKAAMERVPKWGAMADTKAIHDVIAKVLINHKISAFPVVVATLAEQLFPNNPFGQMKGVVPDYRGDQATAKFDQT